MFELCCVLHALQYHISFVINELVISWNLISSPNLNINFNTFLGLYGSNNQFQGPIGQTHYTKADMIYSNMKKAILHATQMHFVTLTTLT